MASPGYGVGPVGAALDEVVEVEVEVAVVLVELGKTDVCWYTFKKFDPPSFVKLSVCLDSQLGWALTTILQCVTLANHITISLGL